MPIELDGFLKMNYVASCLMALVLLAAAWAIRNRGRFFAKAWAPLLPVVHGTVKSRGMKSTFTGEYHGHPVIATITRGGQGTPDVYTIEMPAGPGGRDWEIAHRSENFLGSEMWRVFTADPALQGRLTAEGAAAHFQAWPKHARVRYDAGRGSLTLREESPAPTAEHFRQQLEAMERLVEVNADVNG